jgi:hypothetical protein
MHSGKEKKWAFSSCMKQKKNRFENTHPRELIFTSLPIPPPSIRPARGSNDSASTRGHDPMTIFLQKIVKNNNQLKKLLVCAECIAMLFSLRSNNKCVLCLNFSKDNNKASTNQKKAAAILPPLPTSSSQSCLLQKNSLTIPSDISSSSSSTTTISSSSDSSSLGIIAGPQPNSLIGPSDEQRNHEHANNSDNNNKDHDVVNNNDNSKTDISKIMPPPAPKRKYKTEPFSVEQQYAILQYHIASLINNEMV